MAYIPIDVAQPFIDKANKYIGKDEKALWCKSCAIALAAKVQIPNFIYVSERFIGLRINDGDGMYRAELPQVARNFVRRADAQRSVRAGLTKKDEYDVNQEPLKPFSFSIYIPDKYLRQEA